MRALAKDPHQRFQSVQEFAEALEQSYQAEQSAIGITPSKQSEEVDPEHSDVVWAVAWSPNGKHIASASWDTTVRVWNASNGDKVYIYQGHSGSVYAVVWSPNGTYIASGGLDTTVQVWQPI